MKLHPSSHCHPRTWRQQGAASSSTCFLLDFLGSAIIVLFRLISACVLSLRLFVLLQNQPANSPSNPSAPTPLDLWANTCNIDSIWANKPCGLFTELSPRSEA